MHVTPYHAAWLAALLPGRLEALLAPGVAQAGCGGHAWLQLASSSSSDAATRHSQLTCTPDLADQLPTHITEALAAAGWQAGDRQEALLGEIAAAVAGARSSSTGGSGGAPKLALCQQVAADLAAIGWQHVAAVSADISRLQLSLADAAGRMHAAEVRLPPTYPLGGATASMELPPDAQQHALRSGLSLTDLVAYLRQALQRFQLLWDVLADLDEHAWVLEPAEAAEGPACHGLRGGYGCCHRRVALGGHASLLLTFDPSCPLRPPDASFMGSEAAVGQLQRSWEAGGACWDAAKRCCGRCAGQTQGEGCGGACSVRANVQAILGVQLPGRCSGAGSSSDEDAEDLAGKCAICYDYYLGGETPAVSCPAAACSRPFHASCISDWLQGNPSTRRCYQTLFGSCPFCNSALSVRVE